MYNVTEHRWWWGRHDENMLNSKRETELPTFTELYKSIRANKDMDMSLDRTFSCESTDTASEMMYDSFDQDNYLSELEDACFLDDITEDNDTANQMGDFEYIFWLKKLADVIGSCYEGGLQSELSTVTGAIDYMKYLIWYLEERTNTKASPQSICSFSSIDPDFSPECITNGDLNASFRRKLSFGDDDHNLYHDTKQELDLKVFSKVFDPHDVLSQQNWRYDEDSKDTIVPNELKEFKDDRGGISDMSFAEDDNGAHEWETEHSIFLKGEDANWGFVQQETPTMNNEIYSSLQQMCLSFENDSNDSFTKHTFELPESDEPTDEDIYRYYVNQFPTLSDILMNYCSSEESPKSEKKKTQRKPKLKKKLKAKRKLIRKASDGSSIKVSWSSKKTPAEPDTSKTNFKSSNLDNTQVAEVDSTTISPENNKKTIRKLKIKKPPGPRRPKNGFIRFTIDYRKVIAEKHPSLDNRDVSKMLGQKWRKMTAEERKPYEEQFAHDLEEMKKENPNWKYAADKKSSLDEVEPLPSRLRPRDKLKRKFSPYLIKTSSAKKKRIDTKEKCRTRRKGAIMKCTICSRYHQIYGVPNKNLQSLQSIWFCGLNPDPKYSTCIPKNEPEPEKKMVTLSQAVTITTSGPFTSVVSRSSNSTSNKLSDRQSNRQSMVLGTNTNSHVSRTSLSSLRTQMTISHRIAPLKMNHVVTSGSENCPRTTCTTTVSANNALQANNRSLITSTASSVAVSPTKLLLQASSKIPLSVPASYQPPPSTVGNLMGNCQTLISLFPVATQLPHNYNLAEITVQNNTGVTSTSSARTSAVSPHIATTGSNIPVTTGQAYITVIPKAIFYSLSLKKL